MTRYKVVPKTFQRFLHMGEHMIKYTTKVVMSSYSHIFIHKCKKIESNLFQSLSNHHGALY
jgi:hypothetical protein